MNMSSAVAENSPSLHLDNHIGPQQAKWLAENLEEVDQSVKAILNLIKDGGFSPKDTDTMHHERRPEVMAHVEKLQCMYKSLAEQYGHLNEEMANAQMQNTVVYDSASGQGFLLVTPTKKMNSNKSENQTIDFSLSRSSGHGSSDFSEKGGSEISASSSDSEGEAFFSVANKNSDLRVNVQESEAYTILLRRVTKYEEELKEYIRKLRTSEDEITKLKGELEKKEGVDMLLDNLQDELKTALGERTSRDRDLELEKIRVLKLQEEVAQLEAKLETEKKLVSELTERISGYEADEFKHDQEIKKLNISLFDAQRIFSLEKAKLECDISIMSEQLTLLKARVEASEMRSEFLENETRQCEAEKMEMKTMHEEEHLCLCGEIGRLKADISERAELVETLNKDFDKLKLKYDMLMAEKDGLHAQVQTLDAELSSRDMLLQKIEEKLNQTAMHYGKALEESDRANHELRVKVVELETKVEEQRVVISERGEEKREAIRQLCFSLELYRNDYQELKKALVGHKRAKVLAS